MPQTQLIFCGDNLSELLDECVDLVHMDLSFNFETAMKRQRRDKGFFIAFDLTCDALLKVACAVCKENLKIIPITVHEILAEEVHYRV